MSVEGKVTCPHCGQVINDREITLFIGMVEALLKVVQWAQKHGVTEFERKNIKHLFDSESISARFGDWVHFGGLVQKPAKKYYRLDMDRCMAFFNCELKIPTKVYFNRKDKTVRYEDERYACEVTNLEQLLDDNGDYKVYYQ